MKYSDFEKHISDTINDSTESVEMDSLLKSLNLETGTKSPLQFWLLIPFILLVGGITWAYSSQEILEPSEQLSMNETMENVSLDQSMSSSGNDHLSSTKNSKPNLNNTENNNTPNSSNETTLVNKNQTENNANTIILGSNSQINIDESNQNSNSNTLDNNENISFTGKKVKITKSYLNENQDFGNTANSSTHSTNSLGADDSLLGGTTQNTQPLSDSENTSIDVTEKNELKSKKDVVGNSFEMSKSLAKPSRKIISAKKLDLLEREMLVFEDLDSENDALFSRMKINCPSFDDASWRLALIPEVGYAFPQKTLEKKIGDADQGFDNRISNEKTLEGVNFGLYAMAVRDNLPIYIKAGLSYTRISERYYSMYRDTTIEVEIGTVTKTVGDNGETITEHKGDVITEIVTTGNHRKHSYLHMIDIPVSVGYTTYLGGIDLGLEVGASLNILTRATGNMLVAENEFANLSLNRLFKERIGVNYFGGLMIGKNFGRYGDFYIAPRFTYFPSDFSNDLNQISQKYIMVGINAGVVYNIK